MSDRSRISFGLILLAHALLSGCAVMKAANQPDRKNLSVFSSGVARSHLIAEVGSPVSTREFDDGRSEDVFKFRQGYSKKVRVGRAIAHGAADLATGFLWELAGTPIEMIADGTEVKAVVSYDSQGYIESVDILQGEEAFQPSRWRFSERRMAADLPAGSSPLNRNPLSNPHLTAAGGAYEQSSIPRLEPSSREAFP